VGITLAAFFLFASKQILAVGRQSQNLLQIANPERRRKWVKIAILGGNQPILYFKLGFAMVSETGIM
jgi:hypothetical protein